VPPSPRVAIVGLRRFHPRTTEPIYRLGIAVNRYYRVVYRYYCSHPKPYPSELLFWPNLSLPHTLLPEFRLPNTNPVENHYNELVIRPDYRFTNR
jgi:hypothetical protein